MTMSKIAGKELFVDESRICNMEEPLLVLLSIQI